MGSLIVLAALAIAVFFAVRSLCRSHKSGGGCSGNCANCRGCSGGCHTQTKHSK